MLAGKFLSDPTTDRQPRLDHLFHVFLSEVDGDLNIEPWDAPWGDPSSLKRPPFRFGSPTVPHTPFSWKNVRNEVALVHPHHGSIQISWRARLADGHCGQPLRQYGRVHLCVKISLAVISPITHDLIAFFFSRLRYWVRS